MDSQEHMTRDAETDDEELMRRTGQGDRAAYALLVERHLNRSVGLAVRISGNRADAEEVVQEAFLRVWVNAARWRTDGAKFRTWFGRILVNLCIDRKRKPVPVPLEAAGDPEDNRIGAFDALSNAEESARIRAAMAELPERQRAAVALCYWDEMGNIEAAAVLGISIGALESLLVRARRTLKEKLESDLGGGRLGMAAGGM